MASPIAAIATGQAPSAIGVVRLSGEGVIQAVSRLFKPADGSVFGTSSPQKLVFGTLFEENGQPLDQILATFSKAPHSYTGEDTAELQCHGSPMVLHLALEALFTLGVRQAQPGEFTRRAFLNGKLDLLQAESVMDLIDAQTPTAAKLSAGQLSGALSGKIEEIYQDLLNLLSHFQALVDYPEEGVEELTAGLLNTGLEEAQGKVSRLLAGYHNGAAAVHGVPCAIVGPPNAGKSSLLNALVGYDRAIVTDIPGTTRDTVEVPCRLGSVLLRLTDTAGLRETADPVEKLGVERSRRAMETAQLILLVLDRSQPIPQEATDILSAAPCPVLVVLNKADLPPAPEISSFRPPNLVELSAKTGQGLDRLAQQIQGLTATVQPGEVYLTNPRQYQAAQEAEAALTAALNALHQGFTPDVPMLEVERALTSLAALTGKNLQNDTVQRIFERFCVGK